MRTYYPVYMGIWILACVIAAVIFIRARKEFSIASPQYRAFLFMPWKLATAVVASAGLTLIAPHTGDPTWDYVDAPIMSALTYLTAPWVLGILYQTARRKVPPTHTYVAFCVWMFSVSWFYDTYIFLRDGAFGPLWLENIFASSALYLLGGMFWNLDWRPERGIIFAFMEDDWPRPSTGPVFLKILWPAIMFMIIVALMILPFVFQDYVDITTWLPARRP
ncbi:MAG: hypothetical protein V2B18_11580 [Pseudomonadota bacterium]